MNLRVPNRIKPIRIRNTSTWSGKNSLASTLLRKQCSGFVTFWSGSVDPYHRNYLPITELTIYIIFCDKKLLRSQKTVEIKVFLNLFACWWKDLKPDPDPGGPNLTAPDPEHGQKDFYPPFRVVLGQAGTTRIGEGYVQDIQDTDRSLGGSPRQGGVHKSYNYF